MCAESPGLGFKGDFQQCAPGRFTLEPHCCRGGGKGEGGETCELFNALLKPPRPRTRKNPKLAPNRTVLFQPARLPEQPDLVPRAGETLRQLCLHIVRERERKPLAPRQLPSLSEEKGLSSAPALRDVLERLFNLLEIKLT